MTGRAVYIGHMPGIDNDSPEALFNVDLPGNPYHGSTVAATTINRLGLRELVDRTGRKLLTVPSPKKETIK